MPSSDALRRQAQPFDVERSRKALAGPEVLDWAIRQSIRHCWTLLPPQKRSATAVGAEMRRILERALDDFAGDLRASDVASR